MDDIETHIENIKTIEDTDPLTGDIRSYDRGECKFCGTVVSKDAAEHSWATVPSGTPFSYHLLNEHDVSL